MQTPQERLYQSFYEENKEAYEKSKQNRPGSGENSDFMTWWLRSVQIGADSMLMKTQNGEVGYTMDHTIKVIVSNYKKYLYYGQKEQSFTAKNAMTEREFYDFATNLISRMDQLQQHMNDAQVLLAEIEAEKVKRTAGDKVEVKLEMGEKVVSMILTYSNQVEQAKKMSATLESLFGFRPKIVQPIQNEPAKDLPEQNFFTPKKEKKKTPDWLKTPISDVSGKEYGMLKDDAEFATIANADFSNIKKIRETSNYELNKRKNLNKVFMHESAIEFPKVESLESFDSEEESSNLNLN